MYHVMINRIQLIGGKPKESVLTEYDIDDEQYTIDYFVKPYINERNIYISGALVPFKEINLFKVCTSEQKSDLLYIAYDRKHTIPGVVMPMYKHGLFSDNEYFIDVTRKLLIENNFYE